MVGGGLFILPRTGLDNPLAARSEGDRPKPFTLEIGEFCRFPAGGRGEFGGFDALEGEELGGWGLLLVLARPTRCSA